MPGNFSMGQWKNEAETVVPSSRRPVASMVLVANGKNLYYVNNGENSNNVKNARNEKNAKIGQNVKVNGFSKKRQTSPWDGRRAPSRSIGRRYFCLF